MRSSIRSRVLVSALPTKAVSALLAGFCALVGLSSGCGGGERSAGLDFLRAAEAGEYAVVPTPGAASPVVGASFATEPRPAKVTADHERRPALVLPAGTWAWTGHVPRGARLQLGAVADRRAPGKKPPGLTVTVVAVDGDRRETVAVGRASERRWVDVSADLGHYAGRRVTLEVTARLHGGDASGVVAWGPVTLVSGALVSRAPVSGAPVSGAPVSGVLAAGGAVSVGRETESGDPPNILLIVIDTLRADRLSSYGYQRPTTPRIDQLLADRGVLVERAYAQAPWTLPSVASFMTGRYPGEIVAGSMSAYGIPEEVPALAELLSRRGYLTGGFIANPALFEENGFARGFDTFFSPPASFDWFNRHADDLNRRLLPWVAAHQHHRPFFLYAHYLDPHDPYDNPDIPDGKSPYFPDYQGHLSGRDVHGVYVGEHPVEDPEADVAHLSALYDSEVHYVDRFVGQLLDAFDPEVLADTLVVLTSDHGEELYDHGGWKHGQSLYEEQIRVPLLLRWDGQLPAGRRFEGTAQLLDLLPTLAAAAGVASDEAWQGVNLLPALRGDEAPSRRPAFAQHLGAGPLRAAAVVDGRKLIYFDRRKPFEPPDSIQDYLWRKDLERFDDAELYDLREDPGELRNLYGGPPEGEPGGLGEWVHERLHGQIPGLFVIAAGMPGRRLEGRLRLSRQPEGWLPYFMASGDLVSLEGNEVRFALAANPAAVGGRGFVISGLEIGVEEVEVFQDGEALPAGSVRLAGSAWNGAPMSARELRSSSWPAGVGAEPGIYLWRPEPRRVGESEDSSEAARRLKALGYLGS